MCGPDPNKATKQAKRAEEERQAQVSQATAAIDKAFAGRQSQLDQYVAALRGQYTTEAQRQKKVADRQLKFSLARGGLTGGSEARDAGVNLGREYQQGLLRGEQASQASLGDLMAADESTRQNLLSLAQGGASATTAATAPAAGLRSNLATAGRANIPQSLGDIFANTRSLWTKQQEAAARRRGLAESEVYSNPFSK